MQQPSRLDATPAARIAELVTLAGREAVVSWCSDLLAGRVGPAERDRPPLIWLGGPSTPWL